ncbi:MAG: hypothetical protein ABID61_05350 [Candidatus Micrarchaeota archaeon]
MTEVVEYFCKSCGKKHGPLGMHGFNPDKGDGELPVVCKTCKKIFVGSFQGHKIKNKCSICGSMPISFDGTCPDCGSSKMYSKDIRFGVETKCKH